MMTPGAKCVADMLVGEDQLKAGFTLFTPLNNWGRCILVDIVQDDQLVEDEGAIWQGNSASAQDDGNHADFVYLRFSSPV